MNRNLTGVLILLVCCWTNRGDGRVPWNTSRIQGSPEKPYNYRIVRQFPGMSFSNPVDIAFSRELRRWFVAEQGGKLFSFSEKGEARRLAGDFGGLQTKDGSFYAFTFDPNFASNRFIYVCYALKSDLPDGTHISRFRVKGESDPQVDMDSEEVLITWVSGGHNGCGLKFGPDGYLYISTGDAAGPNPPDPLHTGQDVSDLLSSLLRIDVHQTSGGKRYRIPPDNPFVGRPNTREEIWAFGFRNPWRFGIDPIDGQVWVADVGWELWELIYRVERGGNYGWSIVEGRQSVHSGDPRGPGEILPPIKDHAHSEAASITGGFVYYGKKFATLRSAFLYGDWETGKIWGLRADKKRITYSEELADSTIRVVAFAEDQDGEPIVLDYNGGIYSLEENPERESPANFPRKLSETGLFTSTAKQEPSPGVIRFEVAAEMWSDYATAERFLALPLLSAITNAEKPWRYPSNAVLARTISMEMKRGEPGSRKRLETQILHFNGDTWAAYSYRWNDEQTDAALVPSDGAERILRIEDADEPGGTRVQNWRFHARAECLRCHNPWCGTALGFQPEQLGTAQLRRLSEEGYFASTVKAPGATLVSPYDPHESVARRARSYLHANCSHCHRENAGGSVPAVMNIELPDEKMRMVSARATRGDLGLNGGRVIAPGEPFESILLFRTSVTGRSRMPYVGSRVVDEAGITLLREWIESMSPRRRGEDDGTPMQTALSRLDTDVAGLVARETSTTSGALRLAHAASHGSVAPERREMLARTVLKRSNPFVHELFERFLPAGERAAVSQAIPTREEILRLKGDAGRGAALLADSSRMTCVQCHRFQSIGRSFGPDLKNAVQKLSRAEILDNILEPSRRIAPEYVLYTNGEDEEQVTGIIVARSEKEIVLRDAGAADHRIAATARLRPLQLSAMPEGLLAGMSAQEIADLLEALVVEGGE